MKFIHVFLDYIKFTMRQGRTFWLALLYPIVLILIIGIGLSLGTTNKPILVVCGNDPIIDILSNDSTIRVIKTTDVAEMEYLVLNKKAPMGIHVSSGEEGKKIEIVVDSTKQAVVSNLLLLVDRAISEEKAKSGASLGEIQKKLAPVLIKLKQKKAEIPDFLNDIQGIRANVSVIKNELIQTRSQLLNYKNELIAYKTKLSEIDEHTAELDNYNNELYSLKNEVNANENQRNVINAKITNDIYKIDAYIVKIDNALSYIAIAKQYSTNPTLTSYLNQSENELVSARMDMVSTRTELVDTQTQLLAIDFASMRQRISDVQNEIQNTKNNLTAFKINANTRLDALISDISTADTKISIALGGLDSFDKKLINLKSEVSEIETTLDALISPMEEFLGKKPEELLPPTIVSKSIFEGKKWIDLFFPTILGMDMVLASLLLPMIMKVRMREQGVEMRMLKSKVNSLSVVLGEVLANYTISLAQLSLIFFFGVLFFGISIINPFGFLVVLLTLPLVFTSLGILLSQMVDRSSTAFLLSLLIGIPMIFISGTIIPIEFLNPVIATIGSFTPLYVTIDFAEKLFFRNVPILDVVINYAYLLSFSGVCMVLACIGYMLKR